MNPRRRVNFILCGILAGLCAAVAWAAPRRPNVVFILTDDQRWDMLGVAQREQGEHARFPWLQTPNLDKLAAEGVRFRNAFVVNSLCSPSRATFLTGLYGHANGIVNNTTPFSADNLSWATELRKAGYTTGYFGKWHMGTQSDRPGFDRIATFLGQGVFFDCKFLVDGAETKSEGYVDEVSTDYAIEFATRNKDRPFALVLGYKATHGPFDPPPHRAREYEGMEPRATPNLTVPAIYLPKQANEQPAAGGDNPQKLNWGYIRCIPGIDDHAGKMLDALDRLGLRDSTIVVFAGDNGYYLREHMLGDKRTAYEESLRIPLIVRYPPLVKAGLAVDAMALNVDFAPTILDLAGLPPLPESHGRSWRELLAGSTPGDWRKAWFYAYYRENKFSAPFTTAVRTETAKLIRYPGNDKWTEMFDLTADPYEINNLYGVPAHAALQANLEAEYERQLKAVGFHVPPFAGPQQPEPPPPPAARANAWVLDYRFDRDKGDKVLDASDNALHGTARATPPAEGRDGRKARQFDGTGRIDVPRSPALDPSRGPWTVEATFRSDEPDGIVLARGGKSNGYILHLAGGRPAFSVSTRNSVSSMRGKKSVAGRWTTVRATITKDQRLELFVDDQPAGTGKLKAFIDEDPNDGMEIGADLKSSVLDPAPPPFKGLIESVRIFSGEAPRSE